MSDDTVSLLEGIATTRTFRKFHDEPIPEQDLATMLFAASRGPSGGNAQPNRFIVLRDGPKAKQVKAILGDALRDMWINISEQRRAAAEAGDVVGPDGRLIPPPTIHGPAEMNPLAETFRSVPVVILACMAFHRGKQTDGASIFPSCQNLFLAARALGYGGVMGGFHQLAEPELRSLLGIPDEALMATTIALGRPTGRPGPVRRKPLRDLTFEETWNTPADWAVDPADAIFS